jgi:hypothetical protein
VQVKTTDLTSIWNPKNKSKNVMPIITPAYPPFNSTFNVSKTTKNIILKEMSKSLKIMKRIREGKAPWNRLFKKLDFLKAYRFYLKIDVLTKDYDQKRFFGFIESKLKKLIQEFEKYEQGAEYYQDPRIPEVSLHPWMNTYKLKDPNYTECETFFFGIDLKKRQIPEGEDAPQPEEKEKSVDGVEVVEQDYSTIVLDDVINQFYAGLLPDDENFQHLDFPKDEFPHNVNIRLKVVRREDIPIILNPPEPVPVTAEEADIASKFYIEEVEINSSCLDGTHDLDPHGDSLYSGAKRHRDSFDDTYPPHDRDTDSKRVKTYE